MIRIRSSEEFKRLLEALASDVGDANIHWRLHRDLLAEHGKNTHVWNQSQTFWYLTINAHSSTAVQSLTRAFDQSETALHLLSWLKTIEANLYMFKTSAFKQRLVNNSFVESLAESIRMPDKNQLAADILLCSASDPKVKALLRHRNNISAHTNARLTAAGRAKGQEFGIASDDFEVLLDRAHEIVNRYSSLFAAATYSRKIIAHDDFRYIFRCVQQAVERAHRDPEN